MTPRRRRAGSLPFAPLPRHDEAMRTDVDLRDKLDGDGEAAERGHDAHVRAKVERGLAQSRDRRVMIPVDHVLRDLSA